MCAIPPRWGSCMRERVARASPALPARQEVRLDACEAAFNSRDCPSLCARPELRAGEGSALDQRGSAQPSRSAKSTKARYESAQQPVSSTVLCGPRWDSQIIKTSGSQRLASNRLYEIINMKMLCQLPGEVQMWNIAIMWLARRKATIFWLALLKWCTG